MGGTVFGKICKNACEESVDGGLYIVDSILYIG
ncbi:MAG: hypothetical protein US95_C0006G0024 [Candidatus Woesebacteria bacterium GW2011_GWB1_38_5]|uniref:Uncharacterized protein n=3 Tax=Candidatus Woeseibacteriota TaxID=1752722 RepID=A0A0G0P3T3_9BACT|nr:MAG: hypothetical protein US75_C0017G0013 [Candidatus Woesebacteria bacterium GW2011_GWC1_38_13]KKQ75302.1 MAG: hypothetical protein US95_C0006G0024 [Candidatus Woesebacteria bacterium GW2011_GWB1_38_5]KKQ83956.1 MAG: hypothetical protein UT06_C0012G0021 [Candidatus Woesebacteria bacterium GW2011_GWA1_38_8]